MRVGFTVVMTAVLAGLPVAVADDRNLPVRGVVRPVYQSTIATDLFARIASLDVREGSAFRAGEVLVEFDCAGYHAERKAAVADHLAQKLDYESKLVLEKHSAIGRHEIDVALALTQKAEAEIERLDARIAQCVIKAPYDGRVAELFVNRHEMPAAGNPIIRIIDDSELEIDLIIPSDWLQWLKVGAGFAISIDETGKSYDGHVIRLGAAVDPVSQTIEVRARFVDKPQDVLAGMSGSAKFNPPEG